MVGEHKIRILLVAALLVTSGCQALVVGETPTYEGADATVPAETLNETGYEETDVEDRTVMRPIMFGDIDRDVEINERVNRYENAIPLVDQEFATFYTIATPSALIAEQEVNPVGRANEDWILLEYSGDYYGGLDVDSVNRTDSRTVQSLGATRHVQEYAGEYELESGATVPVHVHVTKFVHGDQYVVGIGIHHAAADGQSTAVDTMLRDLEV